MTPDELARWAGRQIAILIAIGINPLDATRVTTWVVDHLPVGADPNTYVFPADALNQDITSRKYIDDVRSVWFGSGEVSSTFKRLLDARASD